MHMENKFSYCHGWTFSDMSYLFNISQIGELNNSKEKLKLNGFIFYTEGILVSMSKKRIKKKKL